VGLYRRFIDRKYQIYYAEKSKISPGNIAAAELRERHFKSMQLEHQLLALEAVFTEDQVTFLQIDKLYISQPELLAGIGIAQRNNEGKSKFIHRSFAQYFVAEFLISQLRKKTKQIVQVQEIY
jgi:hypothetical protein